MKTIRFRGLVMQKLLLLFSGLVATGVAATIFIAPDAFYAAYGIELAGNASLTNELKAPAGALFVAGLLILLGVIRAELVFASLATASAVFLAYGLSRLLSFALDGIPHSGLVGAAILEIVIGAICLFALLPDLKPTTHTTH